MILHTTEVTALPGYRLFLRFNDGAAGEVDLFAELEGEVFEALRDPAMFATADQRTGCRQAQGRQRVQRQAIGEAQHAALRPEYPTPD